MKFRVEKQEANLTRIEEGVYSAVFRGVEEREIETERGKRKVLVWTFEVETDDGAVEIQGLTSTKVSTGRTPSKAYNWLCAIAGKKFEPDEEIDVDELIGSECVVIVENKELGDTEVSRVVDVKKARKSKKAKKSEKKAEKEETEEEEEEEAEV